MIEQITEKLDAIEVSNEAKIQAVKEEAVAAVEALVDVLGAVRAELVGEPRFDLCRHRPPPR